MYGQIKDVCIPQVNAKNKDGMTALYLAAFYGANRAVCMLLDQGAFADEQVHPKDTSYHSVKRFFLLYYWTHDKTCITAFVSSI